MIGNLDDVSGEEIVSERCRRVFDHRDDRLIPLVIILVQKHCLGPHLVHFTRSDESWNNKFLGIGCDVIHQSLWLILGVHDTQIGIDAVVSIWMSHSLLQERNQFFIVSKLLVVLDEILQVIRMDDDLQTAQSCSLKFFGSNTCKADSFPDLWDIGFLGSFVCLDVIFEHHMNLGKLLIVSNLLEENLCSSVELIFEASLADL